MQEQIGRREGREYGDLEVLVGNKRERVQPARVRARGSFLWVRKRDGVKAI